MVTLEDAPLCLEEALPEASFCLEEEKAARRCEGACRLGGFDGLSGFCGASDSVGDLLGRGERGQSCCLAWLRINRPGHPGRLRHHQSGNLGGCSERYFCWCGGGREPWAALLQLEPGPAGKG